MSPGNAFWRALPFPSRFRNYHAFCPVPLRSAFSIEWEDGDCFHFLKPFLLYLPNKQSCFTRVAGGKSLFFWLTVRFCASVALLSSVHPTGGNRTYVIDPRHWNCKQKISTQEFQGPPDEAGYANTVWRQHWTHTHWGVLDRAIFRWLFFPC